MARIDERGMIVLLETGRNAVRRHAWGEAAEALGAADQAARAEGGAGALSPDDLELLGTASWWAARPEEATAAFERAFAGYVEAGRPTEAAGAAEAVAAEGDAATARRDLLAARTIFERLGATLDLQRVDALLAEIRSAGGSVGGDAAGAGAGGAAARPEDRVVRTFMFTDIVTSTDLVGVIGDEAWAEVLGWHDRELRAAIAEHRGDEVDHAGDGFFVAFERVVDGIECAVDIQRRLVRHRREHGFAPWIRIGLHRAEATRRGRNFSGHGVHVAALVGAAAGNDEIVVSRAVVDDAGPIRFGLSEPREVELKGVKEPVEVRSVDWR